jgi:probable phosphoglycerate mutase
LQLLFQLTRKLNPNKLRNKQIYLIRHGETEFNKQGLVQGSGVDSDLNELGQAQALAFYVHYQHIKFDKIYTSALKRTHQTVLPFVEKGVQWQPLTGLNEISWGVKEGRSVKAEDNMQHYYMLEAWRDGMLDIKVEGGESPLEVQARQQIALEHILAHEHEQTILICMHGRAIRIFLCLLLGISLQEMDKFEHSNVSLYVLNYTDGKYTIEVANNTVHLAPIKQQGQYA